MRRTFAGCIGISLAMWIAGVTAEAQARTPVLVELFTSEGCSSCPPADALLMKLQQEQPVAGAEIIVLGEHVDYWDRLGWRDRFSSHALTQRQNGYGERFRLESVYTPQMVVDGTEEFVGNDAARARRSIAKAAQGAKIALQVSGLKVEGGRVAGVVTASGRALQDADLYAALVDPMATTQVRSGENGGRELRHVGVVRSLQRIGGVQQLGGGSLSFSIAVPEGSTSAQEKVVVFAQRPGQGVILGTAIEPIAGNSRPAGAP